MTNPSQADSNSGPCRGLRVVDMTALVSGPFCSQILADLGAEVIRVESPGSDVMRTVAPVHNGLGAYFEQVNRGKKSLSVNLKSDDDRALVKKLAATADIFLQNSRPGVMERLGLGYEALRTDNPRLIYVSINGFGETGPFANRPAYDAVIQGLTGYMPVQGSAHGESAAIRCPAADKVTAMWACNATLAALLDRERAGGLGQKVVVNMAAAYSAFILLDSMHEHTFRSVELPPPPPLKLGSYQTLHTLDGEVIGMILQPAQFERFATALGRADLVGDPRFENTPSLLAHTAELYEAVAGAVGKMTSDQFLALMDENSIPFGKVNSTAEFLESSEAEHAKAYVDVEDPEFGTIRNLNYPAKFERSAANAGRRAPKLGEHNAEILAELRQPS